MKKLLFSAAFLLSTFFSSTVNAQMFVNYGNDEPEIQNLSKSPIHIVTTGNKAFDDALLASVEKHWKQSPSHKVISKAELNKLLKDPNNFFIAAVEYYPAVHILNAGELKDGGNIAVFNGKFNSMSNFKPFMVIATVPFLLWYDGTNAPITTDHMVKAINEGVDLTIKNDFKGKAGKAAVFTEVNKRTSILKTKKLLIIEGMFDKKALSKYKLPYDVKTFAEVTKMIKDGNKEYCLATIRRADDNKNFFVYDLDTKELVYAVFTYNGLNANGGDLVRINDAAEGIVDK